MSEKQMECVEVSAAITRRSLFGAAAVLGLGSVAALAGCAPASKDAAGPAKSETSDAADASAADAAPTTWDVEETVDVLVAGSGTAGTCAAVRAAELGAKVLCLEKLSFLGGTSSGAEWMSGVNNSFQVAAGLECDPAEPFRDVMAYGSWGPISEVLWEFVNKSADTIQWMQDCGVQFTEGNYALLDIMPELKYSVAGQINGGYGRNGETILEPLRAFGEQFGENLEFRIECPVTHLVIEDDKVTGAFAQDKDGKVIKVNAKSVILATGGFCNNEEYYEKYMNRPYGDVVFYGFEGRDGDALRMTAPLNPRLQAPACMNYAMGCIEGTKGFDEEVNVWFAWNPLLYIDSHGNRFMDEGLAVSMDASLRNISIMTAGRCYAIADENTVAAWDALGPFDTGTGMTEGNLMESIKNCSGVTVADTLDELAAAINVDAANLKAAAEQWNAIGKGEADPVYQTAPETAAAAPVTTGPFYAAQLRASAYGTGGGLATNKEFRVITQDMQPIEGLFAIGTDNGSCYYRDYPMTAFAAFQQGFCATGGRLAAEAAVGKTA